MDKDKQFSGTWAEAQTLKDELFQRASVGELTGDQADAEAIRLGLGSLSHVPGPEKFHPKSLSHWTLPMAVAWIAYRDLDEVREWSAPYRTECFDRHWRQWRHGPDGPIKEGWHLDQRSKPTLALLAISCAYDRGYVGKQFAKPVLEAREELWMALREGLISASGVETLSLGTRREITALDWHELVPVEASDGRDEVRRGPLGRGYRRVIMPSAGLRHLWPSRPNKQQSLPPIVPPEGDGYMPLYCAAQWIATKGSTIESDPQDLSIWRVAYDELLAAISSDKVRVVGTRSGQREAVPGYLFAGCEVDYPFGSAEVELLAGEHLYLRSRPYVDEQHWRDGHDDALLNRREDCWTRLMVEKGDVRARWVFPGEEFGDADMGTGLPGRPGKSKHLIEDEFKRRAAAGELAGSLCEEATALRTWLQTMHPKKPPPTIHTIENNVRDEYRRLKPMK